MLPEALSPAAAVVSQAGFLGIKAHSLANITDPNSAG